MKIQLQDWNEFLHHLIYTSAENGKNVLGNKKDALEGIDGVLLLGMSILFQRNMRVSIMRLLKMSFIGQQKWIRIIRLFYLKKLKNVFIF